MNFYLNDRAVNFTLDNRELKFYPNDQAIDFQLRARQDIAPTPPAEQWVLSTGIWNDSEFWDDNGIWKDN